MKKISNKIVIAVALIVIVCVVYYFQNIKEYKAEIPLSKVVVAKQYIPENTVVTKDMVVQEARYTTDLLKQKGDLTSKLENVLGKRTRVPIYKDEPVNLKRLIVNKPYMDDKDSINKRMFVIAIGNLDKALSIKKGSYIDIWLEPNENGMEEIKANGGQTSNNGNPQQLTRKLFEKLKVYDARTEVYTELGESLTNTGKKVDAKETTVTFLTLYLTDEDIAKYLDIIDWNYNKRVTLYGDNVEYSIINEKIEEKPQKDINNNNGEQENSEINQDMQEIMESPTSTSGN